MICHSQSCLSSSLKYLLAQGMNCGHIIEALVNLLTALIELISVDLGVFAAKHMRSIKVALAAVRVLPYEVE